MAENENTKQVYKEIKAVKALLKHEEKLMVGQEKLSGDSGQAMYHSGKAEGLCMALSALRKVEEVD